MSLGQIACQFIQRAAIGTAYLTFFPQRQKNAGMRTPESRVRHRAMQRQVFGCDFDITLFGVLSLHMRFLSLINKVNLSRIKILYVCKPIGVQRTLPADAVEKQGLQTVCHRAARAATNGTVIQFPNWRNFCRCTGEKCLVGAINFVACDTFFNQLNACAVASGTAIDEGLKQ